MSLVAIGLFALGALRPTTLGFLALLAFVGIGLGCFTPPNNAAIMGSVPEQQSGLASGVLNMTRGIGTALGLALTSLVFDLAGGTSFSPNTVDHAFSLTAFFLGVPPRSPFCCQRSASVAHCPAPCLLASSDCAQRKASDLGGSVDARAEVTLLPECPNRAVIRGQGWERATATVPRSGRSPTEIAREHGGIGCPTSPIGGGCHRAALGCYTVSLKSARVFGRP